MLELSCEVNLRDYGDAVSANIALFIQDEKESSIVFLDVGLRKSI